MAFGTSVSEIALTNGNETSQSSTVWTLNGANNATAGNLAILSIAMDNRSTTDGQTSDVSSVSDSKLNTWTKAGEFTNTVGGAAGDGATIATWYSVIGTTLTTGVDTVTTNYSGNVTAKAVSILTLTIGAGNTVSVAGTIQTEAIDNADAGNMTISGLASKEYLFWRDIARETDGLGFTATTNYTSFNINNRSGTGGSEKNHIVHNGEFRVLTATGDSSNPTETDTTADGASLFIAFQEVAATPTAALTGTITSSVTEADIVAGGKTIILTLTNDTWVASGATFDGQRQNIINGLDSAQSEANGWDAVVKAGQGVSGVVRTSNTVVTITLDAFATYDITATETITATIPSTALTGGVQIVATPTFTVSPTSTTKLLGLLGIG